VRERRAAPAAQQEAAALRLRASPLEPPLFLVATRALRRVATRAAVAVRAALWSARGLLASCLDTHRAHLRRGGHLVLNDLAEPVRTASTPDGRTVMDTDAEYSVSAASMAFARPPTTCVAVVLPSGAFTQLDVRDEGRAPFELPACPKPPPCDSNAIPLPPTVVRAF